MLVKLICCWLAFEAGMSTVRQHTRKTVFAQARARAQEIGRPLVVVGCPRMGFHSRVAPAYDHGSMTIDLHPCGHRDCLCGDITQSGAIPVADDSCVVFVSCVLEYINPARRPDAVRELLRASGSRENLFNVPVGPSTSLLIPSGGSFSSKPACAVERT
jgi:hypothetical protein